MIDVNTVAKRGEMTPWLNLCITGLATKVLMHSWDLSLNASLGSMAIKEMTFGSVRHPLYLAQTPDGAELLSINFMKVVISSVALTLDIFIL